MQRISGVYKITNMITNDYYIGSSKNIMKRWACHRSPSKWAEHPKSKMYQDMAYCGLSNFQFEVIEETTNLKEREQYWIDQLHPTYNSNRAKGLDEEKFKESLKAYYKDHKEKMKEKVKEYHKSHPDKWNNYQKEYQSRLCLYQSETLTLESLYHRFRKQKIAHPFREAKKYLIIN